MRNPLALNIQRLRGRYRRLRAALSAPRLQVQRTVVIRDSHPMCERPIIVMACHRSGTTLLRRILNSHSAIACPPESFFLHHFMDFLRGPQSREGLGSIVGPEAVDTTIRAAAFQYHEAFRIAQGKARWADKTPAYVRRWREMVAIAPPATQWVVILRDPFDVAASVYARGWFIEHYGDRPEAETDLFENTVCYLEDYFGKLADFIGMGRAHVLRYEQLATDPEPVLRRLFQYLGEPWEPAVMTPWASQHNFGIEDPIARGTRGFVPSIGNWRVFSAVQIAVLTERMGPLRRALGYDAP